VKEVRSEPGWTTRRRLLKGAGAVLGGGAAAQLLPSASATPEPREHHRGPAVTASNSTAIVTTTAGKVVGFIRHGIYTYKGIPYGETTEGANRFKPPLKPKSWEGIRSCRSYGPIAPQVAARRNFGDEAGFLTNWDDGLQRMYGAGADENCLCLNVWTPGVGDGKKRPVLMWLHGGGFDAGSSHEMPCYNGENLAYRGDVVVVSINHRLGVLGFIDLSGYGDQYRSAGNAGMLDIVAALEWVRDNIVEFGGDLNRVTVFGQSGGAGKVSVLLGMPAAKGLIHRAIVQSRGDALSPVMPADARRLADQVVAELGLSKETIDKIQTVPFIDVINAGRGAIKKLWTPAAQGAYPAYHLDTFDIGQPLFTPVLDGVIVPGQTSFPRASEVSADVPLMIGSTLNETFYATSHPEYELMTESELEYEVRRTFGDWTPQVIRAFRNRTPNAKPFDLWSQIGASFFRDNTLKMAKAKAALGKAPTYVYWFWWKTPILGGRPGAFHTAELPFVFANTDLCDTWTGGGEDARALSEKVSDAWINFARTGDPNHRGIPHWKPFSPETMPTMIFDNDVVAVDAPDREEQLIIAASGCFRKLQCTSSEGALSR
jgi:para-nitrobenzyl esterase